MGGRARRLALQQLNNLRDENETLKADIAGLRLSAPEDARDYQGGDDLISIYGTWGLSMSVRSEGGVWEAKPSWNEIFFEIGPLMYDECEERKLGATLARSFVSWDPARQRHTLRKFEC